MLEIEWLETYAPCSTRTGWNCWKKIGRLQGVEDYDTILRLGVQLVVPGFADIAVLLSTDDSERLLVAHAEPALAGWVADGVRLRLPAIRLVAVRHQSKGRDFRWVPRVSERSLQFLRDTPELIDLLYDLQVRSFMVVPARAGGKTLGALALCRTRQSPFQAADLAIAQVLAHRIASAIQNAQLYQQGQDEQGPTVAPGSSPSEMGQGL